MLKNAPYCSRIFKFFFASRGKGALTRLTKIPPTLSRVEYRHATPALGCVQDDNSSDAERTASVARTFPRVSRSLHVEIHVTPLLFAAAVHHTLYGVGQKSKLLYCDRHFEG